MALTLPYTSITQFVSTTVHSSAAHNDPHNRLIANDIAIASAVNALETSVASIDVGYIESTFVNVSSEVGTYPTYPHSKSFSYTYTGPYIPISILVNTLTYGGSNATCREQVKWQNASGADMTSYIDYCGLNPMSGGDGGAALNDAFSATIPFIVGSKTIVFQDFYYSTRTTWIVIALTYQKLARPVAWGY